ncbi:MAG: glycoside hydrolase family 97 protein [bacterium]|nr:glycoside hydrolase family 97 protein [bacterium]
MKRWLFIALLPALVLVNVGAHADELLESPSGMIVLDFSMEAGAPRYAVSYDGLPLIEPSELGLRFLDQGLLADGLDISEIYRNRHDETWRPVWGTSSTIRNAYNELVVHLAEPGPPFRRLDLVFRAFDDGVAFRYILPDGQRLTAFTIVSELTRFRFADNCRTWSIPANYDSYEQLYRELHLDELDSANTPITLETPDGIYISLHEADLTDWAGMTLAAIRSEPNTLECDLVPWPDGVKVKGMTPARSPWRTIQIAPSPGGLVESQMILNLNEPCAIEDPGWITPMKYVGIWWGMHVGKETWHLGDRHGATTANTKSYIDFAAERGIGGVLVEGWNTGWDGWGAKDAYDFVTPYPDFDLPAVARYARERGVALIGHHETGGDVPTYEMRLEEAFTLYETLGIRAVKTGYAGGIYPRGHHHHGQWMVRHYRRVVEAAARHGIMLDVHEPIKPTGISRTWPNMMTREGVRGIEYNAWSEGNPPEHTTILPFTRMLAGPLDYTPGIFDLTFNRYKPENRVYSTLANQLALYVVLHSPLQMAADLIENYIDNPAFAFISVVPTTWDETRVIDAVIGDLVCIARRSGEEWFLGCITDEQARTCEVPLYFLEPGRRYLARIFQDAPDADWESNPAALTISEREVGIEDSLTLPLAPGGGAAMSLTPVVR